VQCRRGEEACDERGKSDPAPAAERVHRIPLLVVVVISKIIIERPYTRKNAMRTLTDDPNDIAADVDAVGRLPSIPPLLRVLCETTGMGFAAVARVTDKTWTACAVRDEISFGLKPGGQLDLATTLCNEVRSSRTVIAINHASQDPVYCDHHTPRLYGIESYISVPIVMPNGVYFGNLCAIDPKPAEVKVERIISMFKLFAEMVAYQLHAELQRSRVQASLDEERSSGELREQFIAVLGHDLRNPLAAIAVGAQVLELKLTDPQLVDLARRMSGNARRMKGLIDQLMDFARGRLGGGIGVSMAPEPRLRELLIAASRELADAHPDRVIVNDVQALPVIRCDAERLQQLVSNLLGNAISYGDAARPITLASRIDGNELLISVHNFGEPISAEVIDKIFSPFWRRTADSTREGLGLGLHICNEIVRVHGGRIAVASTEWGGTEFVARLPLNAAA
jgi:signal transduction histidine kinase